jgi:hypothetical protein
MLKGGHLIIGFMNSNLLNIHNATGFQVGAWVYFGLIIGMLVMSIKMTKKMAGKVGSIAEKIVNTAGKVAALAAVTAATAGAGTMAAAGAGMAARGATMAAAKGAGMASRVGGTIMQLGAKGMAAPQLAGKAMKAPGMVGNVLRDLRGEFLGTVKGNMGGLDLDVGKYKSESGKTFTKQAGETANDLGPAKTEEEIENRKNTIDNIEARAKVEASRDPTIVGYDQTLKDNAKKTTDLSAKIAELNKTIASNTISDTERADEESRRQVYKKELENTEEEIKNTTKLREEREKTLLGDAKGGIKKDIADAMGYDLEEHERKMAKGGELEIEKRARELARDQYLRELAEKGEFGKKAAAALRAQKGKYKEKSAEEILIDQIRKDAEKKAKEEAKASEEKK